MTAKGHQLLALSLGIPLVKFIYDYNILDKTSALIALAGIWFGGLLPDIDEPKSYIGRKISFLSYPLSVFVTHRGFTHTFLFAFLFMIAGFFVYATSAVEIGIFLFFTGIGCLFHDIGDMLTKGGIRGFFYPCCKDFVVALLPKHLRFYTNSAVEYFIILVLFCIVAFELCIYKILI
ncbi:metal-dependent hydrolase [Caminibacter sp.]